MTAVRSKRRGKGPLGLLGFINSDLDGRGSQEYARGAMRFLADTPTYNALDEQDDEQDDEGFLDGSEEGYVVPDRVDESPEDFLDPEDDSDLDDGADVSPDAVEGTTSQVRVRPTPTGALDLSRGVQSLRSQTFRSFSSVDEKPMPSRLKVRGIVFAVLIGKDGVARVLSERRKGS